MLNKSSCLASALGVSKFIIVTDTILVTLCCATKPDLDDQQTHLWAGRTQADLFNKNSQLASALGVTKFIIVADMILVTLCFST